MKVLFIGAHPDDNEFACGGLVCKLVKNGHEVRFLSVCNGNGGHHIMKPDEIAARRAKEIDAVAEYLGIQYDCWSDIDDCSLIADLPTRRRMIRYIREFYPDIIVTHRTNDYHADHRNTALLVQDASYLLAVPNECPDVPAMRYMPVIMHSEDTFSAPKFQAELLIPCDDVIEQKVHAISLHESQVYEWLPYTEGLTVPTDPQERLVWLRNWLDGREDSSPATTNRFRDILCQQYGEDVGNRTTHAEAYQSSEYGRQLTQEQKDILLSL